MFIQYDVHSTTMRHAGYVILIPLAESLWTDMTSTGHAFFRFCFPVNLPERSDYQSRSIFVVFPTVLTKK